MTYGGGMLSFASALGVASALLIVAAGTATASHLDLWQTEGRISRVVRDTNPVANPSGKNTPPLKSSGKKPAFGDLDENQEYFHYEEYSNEVEDRKDDGTSGSDPNSVTIIVLSTIAAVLAVFGIVAFVARKYGWYDKIWQRPDPPATEAGSAQLEPLKRNV